MSGRIMIVVLIFLVSAPFVQSAADYQVIVDEKGEALVLIEIHDETSLMIPLPDDVDEVKVSGALFILENHSLELQAASDEVAVLYRTGRLTKKEDNWLFMMESIPKSSVELDLPLEVAVIGTDPRAFIEQAEYTQIVWEEVESISIEYSFSVDNALPGIGSEVIGKRRSVSGWVFVILAVIIGGSVFLLHPSRKQDIIKTLPTNERNIILALKENRGRMRRNELERKTRIAKSSLAASLANLENKKILRIDRTHTVHIISFTRWFRRL